MPLNKLFQDDMLNLAQERQLELRSLTEQLADVIEEQEIYASPAALVFIESLKQKESSALEALIAARTPEAVADAQARVRVIREFLHGVEEISVRRAGIEEAIRRMDG